MKSVVGMSEDGVINKNDGGLELVVARAIKKLWTAHTFPPDIR